MDSVVFIVLAALADFSFQEASPQAAPLPTITLVLEIDTSLHAVADPILLRFIARNTGAAEVRAKFRHFGVDLRHDETVVATRQFGWSPGVKHAGYSLNPGADHRFEKAVMPGRISGDSFEPLPVGTYQLVGVLYWGDQVIESAPITVRISESPVPEKYPSNAVDRHVVNYVEQNPFRSSWTENADIVREQMPHSKLAALITERRLMDRWRRLKEDRDLWERAGEELRRAYEELKRDLTAHMSDPRFANVANFSGELLYAMADLGIAQGELVIRAKQAELVLQGKNLKRDAMDAQTRAAWRLALQEAAAAVERLQKDSPESSFNQAAHALLTRQIQGIRNDLEKRPDSPNAAEFRDALSALEAVVPRNPP